MDRPFQGRIGGEVGSQPGHVRGSGQAADVDHQRTFRCKWIFNLVFGHDLKGTTDSPQKIHLILNLRLLQVEALLAQVVIGSGQEVVGDLIRRRRVGFHKYSKQIFWVDRNLL